VSRRWKPTARSGSGCRRTSRFVQRSRSDRALVRHQAQLDLLAPGESFTKCAGCHDQRGKEANLATLALARPATDLNVPVAQREVINFRDVLQSVVTAKCTTCHTPQIVGVDTLLAGGLDLRMDAVVDTMEMATFPRAYISLAGGEVAGMMQSDVVTPGFSRRSRLIDWLMAVGSRSGQPAHPEGPLALTAAEVRQFRVWVDLGAQYK
jgi:cytochrome c553